jgi:FkbM family methyltransferase
VFNLRTYFNRCITFTKIVLVEIQNNLYRKMLAREFLSVNQVEHRFIGNKYSGYHFPKELLKSKGTIWGVGLGRDSSFEFELIRQGYAFFGFEPEVNCYRVSQNQFRGTAAILENYGLWDRTGSYSYTGENISIVNIFGLTQESEEKLDIRSLWDIALEKKLRNNLRPRILKLNIEGAEREILLRFINDPLDFEVITFQAEFLFHVGFKRIREKQKAYKELQSVLRSLQKTDWEICHLSRNQITLIKKQLLSKPDIWG